jgi:hypothetical protein
VGSKLANVSAAVDYHVALLGDAIDTAKTE